MKAQTLNGQWEFREAGSEIWYPAAVPGGVHTDLMAAGLIPDPFVEDNELRVQWVARTGWEYRRSFTVSPELLEEARVYLVCDGLDTLAEVRLNGNLLGRAENAFRRYEWEIKDGLRPGENEVAVCFEAPLEYMAARDRERRLPGVSQSIPGGQYLRKAPSQFGWDWGPKLPPAGIWKEIRLEGRRQARLSDVHLRQEHGQGRVVVSAAVRIESWQAESLGGLLRIVSPSGDVYEAGAMFDGERLEISALIENPHLWQPNGFGEQPLYRVEVGLYGEQGELDRREYRLGLRTIELRQAPDRWGRSFTFVVNGVPIFAKGSNWIPADSFPTRITPEHLELLLGAAAAANHNMLRVWGGGCYESEAFFDLCDRYGLLVWHDFMFSCSGYPLYEADFLENVRAEVVENVRRLRHRASLALWCGNNEMETGWVNWGWDTPANADLKAADRDFFYATLPAWIAAEDPDRPYWPSSPSSHTPYEAPDSHAAGDAHLWEVWHGLKPFDHYRAQLPRFASEFGFQSLPALKTIAAYAGPDEWNMTSYIMEHHQRHEEGNGKIIAYMTAHYRLPKDFASLVYLTQVLQAEAMRIGIEHWRRHTGRCSGTLYWQLNDCWPVASWSSLDYYGRWKALHYAARRFYAPLLLSIEDRGQAMRLFVTNDNRDDWQGEARWSLEGLDGQVLESGSGKVNAAALATTLIETPDIESHVDKENRRGLIFIAELWQGEGRLALKAAPFVPDKHLALEDPRLQLQVQVQNGTASITLRAESLARHVELSLEGAEVVFSDNYFDLPAGREAVVTFPLPEGWTAE